MDHGRNGAEEEDGVERGMDDVIVALERNGIKVDRDESHNKHGHGAGTGDDSKGWCHLLPSSC